MLHEGLAESDPKIVKLRERITAVEKMADLEAHIAHLRQIGFATDHPKLLELRTRIAALEKAGENGETNTPFQTPPDASPPALSFGPVMIRVITEEDADSSGMLLFRFQTGACFRPDFPISRLLGHTPFAEMHSSTQKAERRDECRHVAPVEQ